MNVAALKSSEVTQAWLRDHDLSPTTGPSTTIATPNQDDDPIEDAGTGDVPNEPGARPRVATRDPGFYADPDLMADERFWDGFEWTSRIRMRPKPTR